MSEREPGKPKRETKGVYIPGKERTTRNRRYGRLTTKRQRLLSPFRINFDGTTREKESGEIKRGFHLLKGDTRRE